MDPRAKTKGRDGVLPEWLRHFRWYKDFPGGSGELLATAGDMGSDPESGRSCGGGNGNPLQYSCLGTPMEKGDWWATVHRVAKSRTWLSTLACNWYKVVWCSFTTEMTMIEWKHTCSPSYISNTKLCDLVTVLHVCLNPLLSPLEKEQCPQNTWLQRFTLYTEMLLFSQLLSPDMSSQRRIQPKEWGRRKRQNRRHIKSETQNIWRIQMSLGKHFLHLSISQLDGFNIFMDLATPYPTSCKRFM